MFLYADAHLITDLATKNNGLCAILRTCCSQLLCMQLTLIDGRASQFRIWREDRNLPSLFRDQFPKWRYQNTVYLFKVSNVPKS
jgi:hypothetical protein